MKSVSSVTWQSWSEKWGDWNAWYHRPELEAQASDDLLAIQKLPSAPAAMIYAPPVNGRSNAFSSNSASNNLSQRISY